MARMIQEQNRKFHDAAVARLEQVQHDAQMAPNTWMGGVVVPIVFLIAVFLAIAKATAPEQYEELCTVVGRQTAESSVGRRVQAALAWTRRRGWTLHDVTRLCVCTFFLHEGMAVVEIKFHQLEEASHPMWTPFGFVSSLPPWEKGDAMDLILLVSAAATAFNLLPEIGLVLLLVDVATDTLDLSVRILLQYVSQGVLALNELTAKKLSLLGVMALVSTHRWRQERALIADRARALARPRPLGNGQSPSSELPLDLEHAGSMLPAAVAVKVPSLLLLVGRLLMGFIFFYAAIAEASRLMMPRMLADIDPYDPHNIVWPKLLEFVLAVPFCLGFRTRFFSQALAVTLAVEALTCWQFWAQREPPIRLHAREHFTVNVALAGGLLLVQEVGGGKYAFDELLKKAS